MHVTKTFEVAVGLFVAMGVAAFFMLAMKVSDISQLGDKEGYVVIARFENIGDLKVRAPVTLAGVRVGRVIDIEVDKFTYEAVVKLSIHKKYGYLPVDTSASIHTAGLLGEKYIGLEPGGMDEYLQEGGTIRLTQSAFVLEKLISRVVANMTSGD